MIELIPIELYTPIYFHILLVVVLVIFSHSMSTPLGSITNLETIKSFGFFLLFFVVLYMGLRPIHGVFVDMKTYARMYEVLRITNMRFDFHDPVFGNFMFLSSKIMSAKAFFFLCAVLYVLPLYVVSKKWFNAYWVYAFLFLVASFSFWAYGVNGIRNGIATSLFLMGVSREKRIYQGGWIVLSIGFHLSMLLPAIGFILANIHNAPKKFLIFWLVSIPLSLLAGSSFQTLFARLITDDPRMSNYLTTEVSAGRFSRVGFRWDFLVYSATAVFAGWYYIFRKQFNDKTYFWLFNTYLFANAFWILVIRANFSNRFAYLSWFMMAFIIIYPLLKKIILVEQHQKIGTILMAYYMFTYIMAIFIN